VLVILWLVFFIFVVFGLLILLWVYDMFSGEL